MPAYAIANLTDVRLGADITEYLRCIDDTLKPFDGRFLIHGGATKVLEGDWPGALIVIEFPDVNRAGDWYASPAYQQILPLRTRNSSGNAVIIEGVPAGYQAVSKIAQLDATNR